MELIEFICNYWQIVVALISFTVGFTTLKVQNTAQEKRICILEKKAEDLNPILLDIRTKLASIETTLAFLTKGLK
jgi:hypothetical protein